MFCWRAGGGNGDWIRRSREKGEDLQLAFLLPCLPGLWDPSQSTEFGAQVSQGSEMEEICDPLRVGPGKSEAAARVLLQSWGETRVLDLEEQKER